MKRVIISTIIFLGITSVATAQTSTGSSSTTSGAVSSSSHNAKSNKNKKPSEKLNNRRIYHFKNGQRSTPTGNEATGTGGGFAALGRNVGAGPKGDTVAVKKATPEGGTNTTAKPVKPSANKPVVLRKTTTKKAKKKQ